MLAKCIERLKQSCELSEEELGEAVEGLVSEAVPAELKADFLCELALKGETIFEIAAFAQMLRDKSILVPLSDAWLKTHDILDVCGTGGDRLNTFNISTTVAILCAAAGVPVAKHGNRAVTSQAGSADVLEALGIRIDLAPAEAADALEKHDFTFFFAPHYHPAFKYIAPARKICAARGQRTIFNFLGPLLNPARPTAQLVGVPRPELCGPLAQVLQTLGARRGMVVSGAIQNSQSNLQHSSSNGGSHRATAEGEKQGEVVENEKFLDELSTLGPNTFARFYDPKTCLVAVLDLKRFPLQPARLADLGGGDRDANAEVVRRILRGEDRGPKRDAVLLNAAAALAVAEHVPDLLKGWERATEVIDSGMAEAKLKELAKL